MQNANLVTLFTGADVRLETGVVMLREHDAWVVRTDAGVRTLGRAFSCLVEPECNDRVLYVSDGARGRILAVLDRPGGGAAVLTHDDGMELRAAKGEITLTARDAVALNSAAIALRAGEIGITTARANIAAGELELTGRSARASVRDATLHAENIDTLATRWTQRVKRAFRFVEESEIVQAGELFHRVRGLFTSRAQTAVITAAEDMKVDGKRIHLG